MPACQYVVWMAPMMRVELWWRRRRGSSLLLFCQICPNTSLKLLKLPSPVVTTCGRYNSNNLPILARESIDGFTHNKPPIFTRDGRLGWPEQAPYDAIHVGAAAHEIPQMLIDQLKPGGRLVIPVGTVFQDLQVVDKNMDGSVNIRTEASVRYVPLTSKAAQLHVH